MKPFSYKEKGHTIYVHGTNDDVNKLYLDFANNFLTVGAFAEHYGISEKQANLIIDEGREINNKNYTMKKGTHHGETTGVGFRGTAGGGGSYTNKVSMAASKLIRTPLHLHREWNRAVNKAESLDDLNDLVIKDGTKREKALLQHFSFDGYDHDAETTLKNTFSKGGSMATGGEIEYYEIFGTIDSVEECCKLELHQTSVDDDGYCNYCGNQESCDDDEYARGGEVTDDDYAEYLNEVAVFDYESEEWIIGGENRADEYYNRYGDALREHDPIGFEVGRAEHEREDYAKGGSIVKKYSRGGDLSFIKEGAKVGIKGSDKSWKVVELKPHLARLKRSALDEEKISLVSYSDKGSRDARLVKIKDIVELKSEGYIDEGHSDGVRYYTKKEALKYIKEILAEDKYLLDGRDIKKFSDDDLFEIGYNFYSIYQPSSFAKGGSIVKKYSRGGDTDGSVKVLSIGKRTDSYGEELDVVEIDLGRLDLGNNYTSSHLMEAIADAHDTEALTDLVGTFPVHADLILNYETKYGKGRDLWDVGEFYHHIDDRDGYMYAKGGRVSKNEDVLESFLNSYKEVATKNLSTHYNEHEDMILLRSYDTLIAKRKVAHVWVNPTKFSKSTSAITNKLKSMIGSDGWFVTEDTKEFADGGMVEHFDVRSPYGTYAKGGDVNPYGTTEDNKLIAEFMGWNIQNPTTIPTNLHLSNLELDNGEVMELKFNTSWDWLMPVVTKCKNVDADWVNENAQHLIDNIDDAMTTSNSIEDTYKAVVQFIKFQKSERDFAKGGNVGSFEDTKDYFGKKLSLIEVYDEDKNPNWDDDAQAMTDYYKGQGKKAMVVHSGGHHALYVEKSA